MSLFLRLALRNVFRNRSRTIVALGAIAAGCAALIVNGGVIYDIFEELREDAIRGRHGHLQIHRRGYAEHHLDEPGRYLLPADEAKRVMELVSGEAHVEHVTRQREFSGMVASGDRYVAFVGIGVVPEDEAHFGSYVDLRQGELLASDAPYEMIAGLGLARRFAGRPGDTVTLMATTDSGALNIVDVRLRGVFEGGMKAYDDWTLKLPLEATADLLLDDRTERIVVLLDSTEAVEAVRTALEHRFREQRLDLEIETWRELALFHNQTVALFERELDVIKLIVATIVILGIANTIGMSIVERRMELATLRALGVGPRSVASLLFAEALITGLVGGVLGIVLGAAIAAVVSAIGVPFPSPPGSTRPFLGGVQFVPSIAAFAFALSVLATLIAAILPVWRAVRRPIAATLRGA